MAVISVPLKTVLSYHMDNLGEPLPDGWEICDGRTLTASQQDINPGGTYVLPDLRNRFLLGADATKSVNNTGLTTNLASSAPGPKGQLGANEKILQSNEFPAHTHTAAIAAAGGHTHSASETSAGAHTHSGTVSQGGAHTHVLHITGAVGSGVSSTGREFRNLIIMGSPPFTNVQSGPWTNLSTQNFDFIMTAQTPYSQTLRAGGVAGAAGYNWWFTTRNNGDDYYFVLATGDPAIPGNFTQPTAEQDRLTPSIGSHSHTIWEDLAGDHSHTVAMDSQGGHSHTISVGSVADHSHTITIDPTGGGAPQAFDTRPRFYGIVWIMHVKY